MTALDAVEQQIDEIYPPLGKRLTCLALLSAGTPRSKELAIRQPPGRRPGKLKRPPGRELFKEKANTCAVVATLVASVAYTSGFVVPGGYKDSDRNAGIHMLLRGAQAYGVFVICNSIALYSSIMALTILLISHVNDPSVGPLAISLSNMALLIAITAMGWAFIAGACVTVIKHAGLLIFVYFLGYAAVGVSVSLFYLAYFPLGLRHRPIRFFADRVIYVGLHLAWRGTAERTAGADPAPTSSVTPSFLSHI